MKTLQDFFLFCSGAERTVLDQCPTDKNKYAGIGATVFFTGLLAFFSSAYALYTVFESYWAAAAFGLVWGLMIFNLDRYIVMSMKSQGNRWRDALVALPRLLLAVLLALVISKPLELRIFEKEIRAEMVQMEQEVYKQQEDRVQLRFQARADTLRSEKRALENALRAKTATRDSLVRATIQEADGTGGSKHKNLGPIYLAKKAEADKAQRELEILLAQQQPLIRQKESDLRQLDSLQRSEIQSLDRGGYNGLAARVDALARLSAHSAAIFWASLFITFLFVAVETAPIMVKLISYRSPYDYLLHQREHVFEMEHLDATTHLSNAVRNKVREDTEIGAHRTEAHIAREKAVIDAQLRQALEGLKGGGAFGASG
jgi:hypothetical protein